MQSAGIAFGLLGAALQSGSYICSRIFVRSRDDSVVRLLLTAHVWMGVASAAVLPFIWSQEAPPLHAYAWAVVGTSGFYLVGQVGLFFLMRTTEASRVAPLLGFKIVILSCISVGLLGRSMALGQWTAVGFCTLAAVALNFSGVSLSLRAVAWVLVMCLGYSLSDLSIERMVTGLAPVDSYRASVMGVAMAYILCGGAACALLPFIGHRIRRDDWLHSLPFAALWLLSMACLFVAIGLIGAVYGNVLQSTRGVMSVALGALLAKMGFVHIEQKAPRIVFVRRCGAAILMVLAIWLFGSSSR